MPRYSRMKWMWMEMDGKNACDKWRVVMSTFLFLYPIYNRIILFLRPEEHGVNLVIGLFDIWVPKGFQKLVKCGIVLRWDLDTDENFADI